jgi:hypothetical protein
MFPSESIPLDLFKTKCGPFYLLHALFLYIDGQLTINDVIDAVMHVGGSALFQFLNSLSCFHTGRDKIREYIPFGDNAKTRYFTLLLFHPGESMNMNLTKHVETASSAKTRRSLKATPEVCAICLTHIQNEFTDWMKTFRLPCTHRFHRECITKAALFDYQHKIREGKQLRDMTVDFNTCSFRCPLCRASSAMKDLCIQEEFSSYEVRVQTILPLLLRCVDPSLVHDNGEKRV